VRRAFCRPGIAFRPARFQRGVFVLRAVEAVLQMCIWHDQHVAHVWFGGSRLSVNEAAVR